jgi:hypothetical protein
MLLLLRLQAMITADTITVAIAITTQRSRVQHSRVQCCTEKHLNNSLWYSTA